MLPNNSAYDLLMFPLDAEVSTALRAKRMNETRLVNRLLPSPHTHLLTHRRDYTDVRHLRQVTPMCKMRPMASAHDIVYRAVKAGELVRGPCEREGEGDCSGRIEAHHDDYGKPLDVRWLCVRHHNRLHHEENVQVRGKSGSVRATIPADLAARLEAEMERDMRTESNIIRRALDAYLPPLPDPKVKK